MGEVRGSDASTHTCSFACISFEVSMSFAKLRLALYSVQVPTQPMDLCRVALLSRPPPAPFLCRGALAEHTCFLGSSFAKRAWLILCEKGLILSPPLLDCLHLSP